MKILEIGNISKKFSGSSDWAVDDFSLEVVKGEIVGLLGESGCGKTTILRMISGFETLTRGHIHLGGIEVAGPGVFVEPQHRKVGIVFQDYALFPHKTVWENILFGLFRFKIEQGRQKAREIITLTGLEGLEKRYPHQLSGGQKQRVALARAMAPEPEVILFDEPFSNIDSVRKNQMREDIRQIIKNMGATAVFVTHDTKDVLAIADRVAVLKNGRALQTDTPGQVYSKPVNAYVAGFFGKTNLLKAKVSERGFETPIGLIKNNTPLPAHIKEVMLSIRPEEMVVADSDNNDGCFCGSIIKERFMGEYKELTCEVETAGGESAQVVIFTPPNVQCHSPKCYFKPNEGKISLLSDQP